MSENGASSFQNRYALHKCNSAAQSPAVPADSPAEVLDASWQCFAMTFNHECRELTGWLNGVSGDRWLDNPKNDMRNSRRLFVASAFSGGLGAWVGLAAEPAPSAPDASPSGCMVMGQGIGTCAALALNAGVDMAEFDIGRLQAQLRKDGVYLEDIPA